MSAAVTDAVRCDRGDTYDTRPASGNIYRGVRKWCLVSVGGGYTCIGKSNIHVLQGAGRPRDSGVGTVVTAVVACDVIVVVTQRRRQQKPRQHV